MDTLYNYASSCIEGCSHDLMQLSTSKLFQAIHCFQVWSYLAGGSHANGCYPHLYFQSEVAQLVKLD